MRSCGRSRGGVGSPRQRPRKGKPMKRTMAVVAAAAIAASALVTAGTANAVPTASRTAAAAAANSVPVTPSSIDWGPCVDPTLQDVRRGVRDARRPAGLREAARQEDPPRGVDGPAHRPGQPVPGHPAGQPGRSGWLRAGLLLPRPVRAERRGRRVRLDRLRPARGRLQRSVAVLHPGLQPGATAELHADQPARGTRLAQAFGRLRQGLRPGRRRAARPRHDGRQRS